jgi:hypothetical protein
VTIQQYLQYVDEIMIPTEGLFELVPDDKIDWTPVEGFFTLGQLMGHIAGAVGVYAGGITKGDWTFQSMREIFVRNRRSPSVAKDAALQGAAHKRCDVQDRRRRADGGGIQQRNGFRATVRRQTNAAMASRDAVPRTSPQPQSRIIHEPQSDGAESQHGTLVSRLRILTGVNSTLGLPLRLFFPNLNLSSRGFSIRNLQLEIRT